MRSLGLSFQKGRVRLAVLSTEDGKAKYEFSRAIVVDPELSLPDLMERYAAHFRAIIDEFHPDIVAAKQTWDSTNVTAAMCQIAPVGIAAYICHEKTLPFRPYTPQALRQAKPFGLPKGTNPIDAVDGIFGTHPPYWDDIQKASLLVAWRALLDA